MWAYTNSDELYHWGIKGMKWGRRRYQNADGTLTPAGKKRYDRDVLENDAKKRENRIKIDGPDPDRWVKEDIKRAKGVVDSASSAVGQAKTINNSMGSSKKNKRLDLSKMSDQEMRSQINRELLERQYNDVFNPPKVSKGKERVGKILDTAGTVLAIGGSALGIALAIKELKG